MNYPIKGTFIDEITYDIKDQKWTFENWAKDLDNMKAVGIDTVIFIRGFFCDKAIFPSKLLSNKDGVIDLADFILKECEKRDMKVFFGMYIKNLTWDDGDSENEIKMNDIFTDEVIERYSKYKSFYGWYIPHEVGNDVLNITDIFYSLSKMCKEKTPDKKVLISPFFYTNVLVEKDEISPIDTFAEWDKIFTKSGNNIDYCAFQDGSSPEEHIGEYFKYVKKACDKHGIELWANVESFERSGDYFESLDVETLDYHINIVKPYVSNIITFEFSHFMSPQADSIKARKLYEDYKEKYR